MLQAFNTLKGKLMLKKLIVLLAVLVLAMPAFATISLLNPVEAKIDANGSAELGKIARGETLEIIVERKAGNEFKWDEIDIDTALLPAGWVVEKDSSPQTLILRIEIPRDAEESIQNFALSVSSSETPVAKEDFTASILVKANLLSFNVANVSRESMVYEPVVFPAVIINDSAGSEYISLGSTLPSYWFEPLEIELTPKQTLDLNLTVYPKTYGERKFSFAASSKLNEFRGEVAADIAVYPTLKSKYETPLFGFPFFTIQMLPYYLINSFLSLIS